MEALSHGVVDCLLCLVASKKIIAKRLCQIEYIDLLCQVVQGLVTPDGSSQKKIKKVCKEKMPPEKMGQHATWMVRGEKQAAWWLSG